MTTALTEAAPPPIVSERDDKGRFLPGVSGNPEGRPEGSRNRITLRKLFIEERLTEAMEDEVLDIMNMAIRMAKQGDREMIKLLIRDMQAAARAGEDKGKGSGKFTININNMTAQQAHICPHCGYEEAAPGVTITQEDSNS